MGKCGLSTEMWCSQCHFSSSGFSNISFCRWNPFVRVWAGLCEIHTVILLCPTISIRQWCSPYAQTLFISSLFWLDSLYLFGQGIHLRPHSNKEFLNHNFWYNKPRALHAQPFSDMFALSFSKRHLPQDSFGVWSGIFFFWPSLEKMNSYQNLQCIRLTVPFLHLLHFLCLVRTAQFCLYGHGIGEKRPIIHKNYIGEKKTQLQNNKPYYSVLLLSHRYFFSLSHVIQN